MVNGTVYLPGATIPITDVGDSYPPGDGANPVAVVVLVIIVALIVILALVYRHRYFTINIKEREYV